MVYPLKTHCKHGHRFSKDNTRYVPSRGSTRLCRACSRERMRLYRQKTSTSRKKNRVEIRQKVVAAYGGQCACCKEERPIFLAIDHIDGAAPEGSYGGRPKRRADHLCAWLLANNYPAGFQILCHNCNFAVRFGACPHKEKDIS